MTESAPEKSRSRPEPIRRKRVLVLASTFPRWDGDTEPPFVFNLSRDLAHYFDVTVLAPHAEGARSRESLDGLEVERFRYFWPARLQQLAYGGMLPNLRRNRWLWFQVPLFLAAEFAAAYRLARRQQFDVIHAHWLVPQGIVAAALNRATGTPVVLTAHGGDVHGLRGKIADRLKHWALGRSTGITAVSANLKEAIAALGRFKHPPVQVISMGVDTRRFHPRRRDHALRTSLVGEGALILFVGRLAEKKGVRYLIEAMPAIVERMPAARLLILGDGALREELEELTRELRLEANVTFGGAIRPDELPPYLATADVFVGPSVVAAGDREGVPVSLMEAMASGCVVVTTDVGGIGELVQDGETGVMVPQRDPAAITEAVCELLADPRKRRRLSLLARRSVRRNFDQRTIAARYATVLSNASERVDFSLSPPFEPYSALPQEKESVA